jgi:hypothetical protein
VWGSGHYLCGGSSFLGYAGRSVGVKLKGPSSDAQDGLPIRLRRNNPPVAELKNESAAGIEACLGPAIATVTNALALPAGRRATHVKGSVDRA